MFAFSCVCTTIWNACLFGGKIGISLLEGLVFKVLVTFTSSYSSQYLYKDWLGQIAVSTELILDLTIARESLVLWYSVGFPRVLKI